MTILTLAQCCRQLAIDPKTLRRWLAQAQLTLQPHPEDARSFGVTHDQLRLLATAHHRRLPALPQELPPLAPSGPAAAPSPLPPELSALLQTLSALPAQLAALQQQLADLSQCLHRPAQPRAPAQGRPAALAVAAARPRPAAASKQKRQEPPRHVLPLVEYAREGHYVVICPQHGLLSLEPDTSAWFAWLTTLSSFRFVGHQGRFTAHREVERLSRAAWRAHRKIRNHTYNLHLGQTQGLTIAVLEQAAADLQAHLK